MGIQRRMEFIRELIGKRWIKVRLKGSISENKQTDLGLAHCNFLPSGNQWHIKRTGKSSGWITLCR